MESYPDRHKNLPFWRGARQWGYESCRDHLPPPAARPREVDCDKKKWPLPLASFPQSPAHLCWCPSILPLARRDGKAQIQPLPPGSSPLGLRPGSRPGSEAGPAPCLAAAPFGRGMNQGVLRGLHLGSLQAPPSRVPGARPTIRPAYSTVLSNPRVPSKSVQARSVEVSIF